MIHFPFTAIVGMEDAKRSLIYHSIDSHIGGVLLMGHRGCAKTTMVRAFATMLQSWSPMPFVEIPLGTSEERLLGGVNAGALVENSKWQLSRGLIEEANGGMLYIDEINLLPDSLADFILDAAASGRYRMERDGFTRAVQSRFILIGTMNPEEGDLRPQLHDRFAHGVQVLDNFDAEQRVEIVRRRIAFDDDPKRFLTTESGALSDLFHKIASARERLKEIDLSQKQRIAIAEKGKAFNLEGIRAELAVVRTARCAAAWRNGLHVNDSDLEEAWRLCLGHRKTVPPAAPNPPAKSGTRTLPPGPAFHSTSITPFESANEAKVLPDPIERPNEDFFAWLRSCSQGALTGGNAYLRFPRKAGSIAWIPSVIEAIKAGWSNGNGCFELLFQRTAAKPSFWCFLDASRSTGMNRLAVAARDLLSSAKLPVARFHLLLLSDGKINWISRRVSASRFVSTLFAVSRAAGKSKIIESLQVLARARTRAGMGSSDLVLIVSDGLASPRPGETTSLVAYQLRTVIQRLLRTGARVGWLEPPPVKGLSRWLGGIYQDLPLKRFQLKPDSRREIAKSK
ncbi:MAG: AAA family ATPase [Verrucomicrobia bacterium]|nr:AAA family ATPase [Verrucomicrobiota bacterium]